MIPFNVVTDCISVFHVHDSHSELDPRFVGSGDCCNLRLPFSYSPVFLWHDATGGMGGYMDVHKHIA